MIVLHAYEIDDGGYDPYWEVYDYDLSGPPDTLTEDEFGDWINSDYCRANYDVRVNTIQSYYEGLYEEYQNVD